MSTLAYFITFHTYGTWLHGRAEGSVDDEHATPGTPLLAPNPARERRALGTLKHAPLELDIERRFVVNATIREVCVHRRWMLHALHVRATHVHVVVFATHPPERVLNDFKAYATRRMREAGVLGRDVEPWSYHGSTRYLNTEGSLTRAIQYSLHEQGEPLDMRCPAGWTPRASNEPRA